MSVRSKTDGFFRLVPALLLAALSGTMLPATAVTVAAFAPTRFHVTVIGRGPDVILVAGLASAEHTWNAEATKLKDRFRVHIIQISGFAGTPAGVNASGPVIGPVAAELDTYIKSAGLKNAAVIGHSLGGLVTLELARSHPEDTAKIMLVDALPFAGAQIGAPSVAALQPQATALRDMIAGETQAAYAATSAATAERLVTAPQERVAVASGLATSDHRTVADATYDGLTTDVRPDLPSMMTPITVLYASRSAAGLPVTAIDALYSQAYAPAPNHRVLRVDDAAHFIMLDQPAVFGADVEAFLGERH